MAGLDFAEETPLRREPLCNQPFPGGGEAGNQRFPATTVGVSAGGFRYTVVADQFTGNLAVTASARSGQLVLGIDTRLLA
jgi:hypothetical protein